jgi:trimeric autotransporter adhesin
MKQKAFTLIELLVVMSIVGLLGSIVSVNVSDARNKAKITKSVSFSQQIYNALGSEALGYWDFNDSNPSVARDVSGNGNNCTINGATPVDGLSFSGGNFGRALQFNGLNNWLNCVTLKSVNEKTFEFWVRPNSETDRELMGVHSGNYYLETALWHNNLLNVFYRTDLMEGAFETPVKLNSGSWHHVVVTVTNSLNKTTMKTYVDGLFGSSFQANGTIGAYGPLTVGKYWDDVWTFNYFDGAIDEVRVYDQVLLYGEIQKHYVEGLNFQLSAR